MVGIGRMTRPDVDLGKSSRVYGLRGLRASREFNLAILVITPIVGIVHFFADNIFAILSMGRTI
jgi:hypothetical protein